MSQSSTQIQRKTHDRIETLIGRNVARNRLDLATPESVLLHPLLASHGERLTALVLDMLFWLFAVVVVYLLAGFLFFQLRAGAAVATLLTLLAFIIRNLYFIYFETLWGGITPGKRITGLRVISRDGGPLRPAAIIGRNLTREVEVFLPLSVYFATQNGDWEHFVMLAWCVLLAALPLFNKNHMRAGDFLAGTVVIQLPQRLLLTDLAGGEAAHKFTSQQLALYGAFELQVLEEVLRRAPSRQTDETQANIAKKIADKIGYEQKVMDVKRFLLDFYAAQRANLEREKAFGRSWEDKSTRGAKKPLK